MARIYSTFDVPVQGGSLRVGRWRGEDPDAAVILAAHGVTANHVSWALVGQLARATVVAVDLRGRGRSSEISGPAGMAQHSADLLAVADHLGADRVTLAGHSMGGFVVSAFHELHPERTTGVVLVDGGLPLPPPPEGMSTEEAIAAIIGPAAKRLTMSFASVSDYYDYWREHPALAPSWSDAIEAYLAYDLVQNEGGAYRSSVTLDSVREDSADLLDLEGPARRAAALPPGTVFLRAPFDLFGAPGGLYPPELMAKHAASFPSLDVRDVPDVNHYTLLLSEQGASQVAAILDEAASN
jgi:pimeloyl-ACP methyl ester carboxylesterase